MVKHSLTQLILGKNMTREQAEELLKHITFKGKKHRTRKQLGDEPSVMPDWQRIESENEYLRSLQKH